MEGLLREPAVNKGYLRWIWSASCPFVLSRQFSFFLPESPEELLSVHSLAAFERSPALVDFLAEILNLEPSNPVPLFKPQYLTGNFAPRVVAAGLHFVLNERL
jgi:hypothetical protein